MATKLLFGCHYLRPPTLLPSNSTPQQTQLIPPISFNQRSSLSTVMQRARKLLRPMVVSAAMQPLDLTEENVDKVLADARVELAQLFDESVGITGQAELAELDGPFVKIRLRGRFWHKRSTVLARLHNYLKQRIPEILEVHLEDVKQLDDSPWKCLFSSPFQSFYLESKIPVDGAQLASICGLNYRTYNLWESPDNMTTGHRGWDRNLCQ